MTALSIEDVMGAVRELRLEMQAQLTELRSELAAVRAQQASSSTAAHAETQEVSEELLVIMAAVVTQYLGKKVRIHSAKAVHAHHDHHSAWAQHGRTMKHMPLHLTRGH
ncbi:MAG: hypothetical protein H7840_15530 [Alphaproteobacteria bacterium]